MEHHYFLQDAQGAYYSINGPTMIGRDPTCQIRLSDSEVSRTHALLWVDRRNLYIRDEGTKNGTYLNELPIPPNRAIALSSGSQLRLGNTFFTVVTLRPAPVQEPAAIPAPVSAPQRPNRLPILLGILIGSLCLGVLLLAAGYFFLKSRVVAPTTPTTPATSQHFTGMTVLATSVPQQLLTPKEFVDASKTLALSVAKLNTAELVFIRHTQEASPAPKTLDDDLREVAAQAMNVALLAEKQGYNAASQGGSSAGQYYSIARLGYALVIESQNLRQGLQKQTVSPAQALKTITQYGARLWNPQVSDPVTKNNPFLSYAANATSPAPQFLSDEAVAQLKKQTGPGAQLQTWMASSAEMDTLQIDLPALGKPLSQQPDPALLQSLTQAAAQADMDTAQLAAAAKLAPLPPTVTQTLPPTVTQTLLPSATFTPDKTLEALGTQVAAEKTAEFQSTLAAIEAQTQQAAQSAVFTLKGTFGLTEAQQDCNPPLFTSGMLQITVNFGAGSASGTLNGGGSASTSEIVCGNVTYDMSCQESYAGSFSGGVNPASGALSMSGNVKGSRSCTFSNCKQDDTEIACEPGSMTIANPVTVSGVVIQSSSTGNGTIQTCAGCSGDWSAGK